MAPIQPATVSGVPSNGGSSIELVCFGASDILPRTEFANQIANQLHGTPWHWASQASIIGLEMANQTNA
jgi:hypothetical protein